MASRRRYLTTTDLAEYADITITDTTEAEDQISHAEELIDAYVGPQESFIMHTITGRATAGTTSTLTLRLDDQNRFENDYFKWLEVEIIGGTGEGQHRTITGSTKAGVLTVDSTWTAPDTTSFYKIYQLAKFPRFCDVTYYSEAEPYTYYKQIPDAVKRAVAAQVEYMIDMGSDYFSTDIKASESIGDYSYSNVGAGVGSSASFERFIGPKVKALLTGIKNITGRIIV